MRAGTEPDWRHTWEEAIMAMRSASPAEGRAPTSRQRARAGSAHDGDRGAADEAACLAPSALEFATSCHAGQRRQSDGAPFIEHPLEVAGLLRDAGCSDALIAAGLLHDVLEDTDVSRSELTQRFGDPVADLVEAVTDHASVESYRRRKQVLREQVRSAGRDAMLLFAADKISKVRELADQLRRDRARFGAPRAPRALGHLEHYQEMRLEHYQESLAMLQRVAPRHPLAVQLAEALDACPLAILRGSSSAMRAARGASPLL